MYIIGKEEIEKVSKVINEKKLFRYRLDGSGECQLFEKELSEKLNISYAILLTSGTNAIAAALASLGVGPGDEVIIPSYTFFATAFAVTMVGAIPVIAEINANLTISIDDIKAKYSDRTKAIIPVHINGLICDMDPIMSFAKDKNLFVVEDACQAFGGSYKGKPVGTIGNIGCFSFNNDKIITAGEGGAVVTNDKTIYEKMFCMMDGSAFINPCNKDFFEKIKPFFGLSMRVSEITGAILRVQLERLDTILKLLRERKNIFIETFKGSEFVRIVCDENTIGDCSTTVHFQFKSSDLANNIGKRLRDSQFFAYPLIMKPGSVCWKWGNQLGTDQSSFHNKLNPYQHSDKKYSYKMPFYLNTVDIVTKSLRFDIDIDLSIEATKDLANNFFSICNQDLTI